MTPSPRHGLRTDPSPEPRTESGWKPGFGNGMPKSTPAPQGKACAPSEMNSVWTQNCAPVPRSHQRGATDGPKTTSRAACSSNTSPTCTSAGPRDTPASPAGERDPRQATEAAPAPCIAICGLPKRTSPAAADASPTHDPRGHRLDHAKPDNLDDHDEQRLKAILVRLPGTGGHSPPCRLFRPMIRDLRGDLLPNGSTASVSTICQPSPPSHRTGTRPNGRDRRLTLPYSNGPTEGAVNRIKMIKRSMFGRANFDILRKRSCSRMINITT